MDPSPSHTRSGRTYHNSQRSHPYERPSQGSSIRAVNENTPDRPTSQGHTGAPPRLSQQSQGSGRPRRLEFGMEVDDGPPVLDGPYAPAAAAPAANVGAQDMDGTSANLPGGGGMVLPIAPQDTAQYTTRKYESTRQFIFYNDNNVQRIVRDGALVQFQGGWKIIPDNNIGFYMPPAGVADFSERIHSYYKVKSASWKITGARYRYITEYSNGTPTVSYSATNASFPLVMIHTDPVETFNMSSCQSQSLGQGGATATSERYEGLGIIGTRVIPDNRQQFTTWCTGSYSGYPWLLPFYLGNGKCATTTQFPTTVGALQAVATGTSLEVADPFIPSAVSMDVNKLIGYGRNIKPVPGWQPCETQGDRTGRILQTGYNTGTAANDYQDSQTTRNTNYGFGNEKDYSTICCKPIASNNSIYGQFRGDQDVYFPHQKYHWQPCKMRVQPELYLPNGEFMRCEVTIFIKTEIELLFLSRKHLWSPLIDIQFGTPARFERLPHLRQNITSVAQVGPVDYNEAYVLEEKEETQ